MLHNHSYTKAWLGTTSTFSNSSRVHASLGESKHKFLSNSIPGPWRFFRVDRRTGVRCNILLRYTSGVAHECLLVIVCKYLKRIFVTLYTVSVYLKITVSNLYHIETVNYNLILCKLF